MSKVGERGEATWLRRLEERESTRAVALLAGCVGVTLATALLDVASGIDVRVFPLYFIPIAIAAFKVSTRSGLFVAFLCSGLWLLAMVAGRPVWTMPVFVLNALTQTLSFFLIALLVGSLSTRFEAERRLGRQDSLTGLHNARSFLEVSEMLFATSRRTEKPITLAYVDLDNFKAVNDDQGHARGDLALIETARALRRSSRRSDLMARLGGDEFALLLPDTDEAGAQLALERLAQELRTVMRANQWPVTASIGAVTFTTPPAVVEDAVKAADRVMYRVKESGKDGVLVQAFDAVQSSRALPVSLPRSPV